MSKWQKIVTSGSHAELRRLDAGPISTTDRSYDVIYSNTEIVAGQNFIPDFTFQFGAQQFGSGDTYYGSEVGAYSNVAPYNTYTQADVDIMFDGSTADYAVVFSPIADVDEWQYLYITLPYNININSWQVFYASALYLPQTDGIWQYSSINPSDAIGFQEFDGLWTDWNGNQSTPNGTTLLVTNNNETSYRYWRFKHKFDSPDNAIATAKASNFIRDIQATTNASIIVDTEIDVTPTVDEFALRVTGSAKITDNLYVNETGSFGYIDIDTGLNVNNVNITGNPTFQNSVDFDSFVSFNGGTFFANFQTDFLQEETWTISSDGLQSEYAALSQFQDLTGFILLEILILGSRQGGLILDYTLTNGSSGRAGQFMLTKIGTDGDAIYDFTDISTNHIGTEYVPAIPYFSASFDANDNLVPQIVNGNGYTLRAVAKRLTN